MTSHLVFLVPVYVYEGAAPVTHTSKNRGGRQSDAAPMMRSAVSRCALGARRPPRCIGSPSVVWCRGITSDEQKEKNRLSVDYKQVTHRIASRLPTHRFCAARTLRRSAGKYCARRTSSQCAGFSRSRTSLGSSSTTSTRRPSPVRVARNMLHARAPRDCSPRPVTQDSSSRASAIGWMGTSQEPGTNRFGYACAFSHNRVLTRS